MRTWLTLFVLLCLAGCGSVNSGTPDAPGGNIDAGVTADAVSGEGTSEIQRMLIAKDVLMHAEHNTWFSI